MSETQPIHDIYSPRYDINETEVRRLTEEFVADPEVHTTDTKFGCYVLPGLSHYSNLGRYVESTVFFETFNNRPDLLEAEYAEYDPASEFYVVIDHEENLPVGVMRIIKNSDAGLKSLEDLEKMGLGFNKDDVINGYDLDADRTVDVSTLAVLDGYRNFDADFIPSKLTYRTLFLKVLNSPDFDHTVAIIDKKAEKNLKTLKFPFSPIFSSGYFSYLDSDESVALIAQNSMFKPQLTYWIDQMKNDADSATSDMNGWLADTIDSLINARDLDGMLGFNLPDSTN